jgi:hypothetical protein
MSMNALVSINEYGARQEVNRRTALVRIRDMREWGARVS